MSNDHIDEFNTIVGLVFAHLYQSFPVPRDISPSEIGREMGLDGSDDEVRSHILSSGRPFGTVLAHSLTWLRNEGFTYSPRVDTYRRLSLTAKALAAMNATPAGLDKRLGEQLTEAAKGAASEAGKSAIRAVVGEVIGGFVKGAFGS